VRLARRAEVDDARRRPALTSGGRPMTDQPTAPRPTTSRRRSWRYTGSGWPAAQAPRQGEDHPGTPGIGVRRGVRPDQVLLPHHLGHRDLPCRQPRGHQVVGGRQGVVRAAVHGRRGRAAGQCLGDQWATGVGPTIHRDADGHLEGAIAVLPVDGDRRTVGLQPRPVRGKRRSRRGGEVHLIADLAHDPQAAAGVGRQRNGLDAHLIVAPSPIAFARTVERWARVSPPGKRGSRRAGARRGSRSPAAHR